MTTSRICPDDPGTSITHADITRQDDGSHLITLEWEPHGSQPGMRIQMRLGRFLTAKALVTEAAVEVENGPRAAPYDEVRTHHPVAREFVGELHLIGQAKPLHDAIYLEHQVIS